MEICAWPSSLVGRYQIYQTRTYSLSPFKRHGYGYPSLTLTLTLISTYVSKIYCAPASIRSSRSRLLSILHFTASELRSKLRTNRKASDYTIIVLGMTQCRAYFRCLAATVPPCKSHSRTAIHPGLKPTDVAALKSQRCGSIYATMVFFPLAYLSPGEFTEPDS